MSRSLSSLCKTVYRVQITNCRHLTDRTNSLYTSKPPTIPAISNQYFRKHLNPLAFVSAGKAMYFLECTLHGTWVGGGSSFPRSSQPTRFCSWSPIQANRRLPVMSSFCPVSVLPPVSFTHSTNSTTRSDPALWADNTPRLVRKSPTFCANRTFITVLTKAGRFFFPLSQMNPVNAHPVCIVKIHFDINFPFTVRSSKWLFPSDFPTN